MNGFTSGTQALQGRKVNHDPKPWLNGHGVRIVHGIEGLNRNSYDPRPEFDVLDNPILAEFRQRAHSIGLAHAVAGALLDSVTHWWNGYTMAERAHARRVLKKLDTQLWLKAQL